MIIPKLIVFAKEIETNNNEEEKVCMNCFIDGRKKVALLVVF